MCKLEDKPQFEIDFASITKQKHSGGSCYGSIKWMVFQGANNTDPGHFEILKILSFVKKRKKKKNVDKNSEFPSHLYLQRLNELQQSNKEKMKK